MSVRSKISSLYGRCCLAKTPLCPYSKCECRQNFEISFWDVMSFVYRQIFFVSLFFLQFFFKKGVPGVISLTIVQIKGRQNTRVVTFELEMCYLF